VEGIVADIFNQYILFLKRNSDGKPAKEILSNPIFHESMAEAHSRLKDGTAIWHSYDDVFGN